MSSLYGFEVKATWLDSSHWRSTSGGEMSEIRPEPYEAPSVEEVDTDGKSIATASGVLASAG
jgi:hypothetical protein